MNYLNQPIIAICYDFDKTLIPNDMQAYGLIDQLGMTPAEFWGNKNELTKELNVENILGYLYYTMKVYKEHGLSLTRKELKEMGKNIDFFEGVETWFKRINEFSKKLGVQVEHYVISSGLTAMIEGTSIAKEFKDIFACDFIYGDDGQPVWPATSVNFTTKTQILYRINKGLLDVKDMNVNAPMDKRKRRIPFSNIIYIGDSATDIPSMRLTVKNGGHSIGVYHPKKQTPEILLELVRDNRINFFAPADYREFSMMDSIVKDILLKIKHSTNLQKHTYDQKDEAKEKLNHPLLYIKK